jgi:rhodanese-related sulfurtransferase
MKLHIIKFLFVWLLVTSCNAQTSEGIQTIPPHHFADKLKSETNPQLLDVRTPAEYSSEHLDGAMNMDWNGADFESKAAALNKSEPVFVYCKVGGRSAQAANKLQQIGFKEIYNMDGGILKWNSAGLGKPAANKTGMSTSEFNKLIASDKKVLINLSATWCAPCKKMKPFLVKLQDEMKSSVKIVRLDADEQKSLMAELNIDELPALLLYEDGKMTWKHFGYMSEEDLKKQL